MSIRLSYIKKIFKFNFNARTSRGEMQDKISWFIKASNAEQPDVYGIGECGPLPGLSIDSVDNFEAVLKNILSVVSNLNSFDELHHYIPAGFPSIVFGIETALLDLQNGGKRIIYHNDFVHHHKIPINGLIWMGDKNFMIDQIKTKIAAGFNCIKLKVGGLDFDRECDILKYIRTQYSKENIIIRLDANGAFKPVDALRKLEELAKYNVHSIEQPIKPGLALMEELCKKSPIPIAFDEELIGKETKEQKLALLEELKPQFIVLKPTLHGGLQGCTGWIDLAEKSRCGWWITSALESNIGLNAICQFTANYRLSIPQGLGTGSIYENNIASPLRVEKGNIFDDPNLCWNLSDL